MDDTIRLVNHDTGIKSCVAIPKSLVQVGLDGVSITTDPKLKKALFNFMIEAIKALAFQHANFFKRIPVELHVGVVGEGDEARVSVRNAR